MRIAGRAYTVAVNLKDNVSGKLKGLTDGLLMGAGGLGVGMLGTAGIGYGVVNAAQAYMGFEKQMSRVQAVGMLDKNSPEMQSLTQLAKDLGASTAWTREQIGQAEFFQMMAGWSPDLIMKATKPILNLASAGATDLATTSDIVTDTLTGFQIKANETYVDSQGRFVNAAEHYADIMAKLVTSANTDIPQLGEALKYSSNVVGAMYADKDIQTRMHAAEDAMVMTGLMANAGIKGSMAGTATRAVFSRFGSENRNAYFGLQALGVDFKDANGEVRRIRDIFHDLNQRFSQGISAEGLADFAEMMSETKLHADTRRKLTSFMESVQAHGGKMTGAERLKLSSMLAGQEAMSGFMAAIMGDWDALGEKIDKAHGAAETMAHIQLDNLSGSLTLLGSAWDAFQQSFFEGQAGQGIRSFVDSLTEVISRANKLFADGIQIGDIGNLITDVIDRLKNKFMELDGIGSILAGGALMGAFVKIGRMIQRVIGYAGQLKGLQIGQILGGATGAGAKSGTISSAAQVGTMNVTAGVVNLNGKAGAGGGTGGGKSGGVSIYDRYQREKERIRGSGAPPPPSMSSTFMAGARGGALFAGIFAAMDIFNSKSISAERTKEATDALNVAKAEYQELVRQNAGAERLAQQAAEIQRLQGEQNQIIQDNQARERETLAGATGSVLGAAIGAGLGSIVGPMGTMIGGMLGGIVGDALGHKALELGGTVEEKKPDTDYFGFNEKKKFEGTTWEGVQLGSSARRRVADAQENIRRPYDNLRGLDSARRRIADAQERATLAQMRRFEKIDAKLRETGASPFQHEPAIGATLDYYRQQREQLAEWQPTVKPVESLGGMFDSLLFNKASAAELSPEQQAYQTQMERPRTLGEAVAEATQPSTELTTPEPLDFSSITEQLYSDMEAFTEGINELFSGIGESISETLTTSFEGVGETFTGFTDSITENLTSAFEGISEYFSEIGATFSENLSASLESVSTVFTGFGEQIMTNLTSTFTTAQASTETALTAIGTAFETTRTNIQTSWAELPGFFAGIFSGLGSAAAAAGSAIAAGLTAPIGQIIGAWQSAAAQISSIISSISAQAASMPSVNIGGTGAAYASGGFVTSPTQALIGEAGAEVVIPLSAGKRARALDLFDKTAAILGGDAGIPSADFLQGVPELESFGGSNFSVDADTPITKSETNTSNTAKISMGGLNVSFTITGANDAQDVMRTIKENLEELADKVAGQLGTTLGDSFDNMAPQH